MSDRLFKIADAPFFHCTGADGYDINISQITRIVPYQDIDQDTGELVFTITVYLSDGHSYLLEGEDAIEFALLKKL